MSKYWPRRWYDSFVFSETLWRLQTIALNEPIHGQNCTAIQYLYADIGRRHTLYLCKYARLIGEILSVRLWLEANKMSRAHS